MTPAINDTNDMITMQQEAMRRVQEMQDRARRTVGLEESVVEPVAAETPPPPAPQQAAKQNQDNETTLITLLLLILMAENASPEMTFALLYLLAA